MSEDRYEPPGPHEPLDFRWLLGVLRGRSTEWLVGYREWLVREQRRLRVEELAVLRVLDERREVDDTLAQADGVSVRSVRATLACARALEGLPQIAAAAAAGELSGEQLAEVVKVAEPGNPADDARWAAEAVSWSPADVAQQARTLNKPTPEDAAARRAARELRFWWNQRAGMLDGRFSLPDIDGALFEAVIQRMVEQMRPATGEPWESRARRGADALVALCRGYAEGEAPSVPAPLLRVEVPQQGPATIAGIPLSDATVEALRAQARVEPVLVDQQGAPVRVGRTEPARSDKARRAVTQRDGKCRFPGCDRRVGLEVHHLWPASWGGADHFSNLATVCVTHHTRLVPQGPWLLVGNPNAPNGLRLVHRDELTRLAQHRGAKPRAGPGAA